MSVPHIGHPSDNDFFNRRQNFERNASPRVHKSLTATMSTPKNTSLTTVRYIQCGLCGFIDRHIITNILHRSIY